MMEFIKSASGHNYIYDRNTGYISLSGNSCDKESVSGREASRASDKLDYLIHHGLISRDEISDSRFRLLSKKDITDAIANTHQIILEVTERCNLDCHYCGYGHLYDNYDARLNRDLSFDSFKAVYNHLKSLWEDSANKGCTYLRISFYGGEPLCNFRFIHDAVMYVRENPIRDKRIVYSMTTNAVLLDRYMDFLAENNFEILISLDGDRANDSYRTFKDGRESFDTVISNVDRLKSTYPEYFREKVKFNSVLHDRNSIVEANGFIFGRYGKRPMTNELNGFGIAKDKRTEFMKMFHSKINEFKSMGHEEKQMHEDYSPYKIQYEKWVFNTLMNVYSVNLADAFSNNYNENKRPKLHDIPTNTCVPFSRKIFISVNGKIFPCERIGN